MCWIIESPHECVLDDFLFGHETTRDTCPKELYTSAKENAKLVFKRRRAESGMCLERGNGGNGVSFIFLLYSMVHVCSIIVHNYSYACEKNIAQYIYIFMSSPEPQSSSKNFRYKCILLAFLKCMFFWDLKGSSKKKDRFVHTWKVVWK